jgi:hypothetical protein
MDTNAPGLVSRLQAWAAWPITNQMDITDVVLSTVLITTVVVAWLFIMRHITHGAVK